MSRLSSTALSLLLTGCAGSGLAPHPVSDVEEVGSRLADPCVEGELDEDAATADCPEPEKLFPYAIDVELDAFGIVVFDDYVLEGTSNYYEIILAPGTTHLAIHASGGTDTVANLYEAAGTLVASDDDGGEGTNFSLSGDTTASVYYLEVYGYGGSEGEYGLQFDTID